jgi:hypothetical protein
MNRRLQTLAPALALAALFAAPQSSADAPTFEITPFVGARVGGGFDVDDPVSGDRNSVDLDSGGSFGIDLGLYAHPRGFYELLYSSQETSLDSEDPALRGVDMRIDHLQVGGTAFFPQDTFFVPYLSLAIGAAFLKPLQGPYDSETKFSASLGGGFRFPVNEHVGVNLGLRGYLTVLQSDTDLFCVSGVQGGSCLLRSSGATFFQTEAQLGISLQF